MSAKRYQFEVDPATQGALFDTAGPEVTPGHAAPEESALAYAGEQTVARMTGQPVAAEAQDFPDFQEVPDYTRSSYEYKALQSLARESSAWARLTNATGRLSREVLDEAEQEELNARAVRARQSLTQHRIAAKTNIAYSLGIPTTVREVPALHQVEGEPTRMIKRVIAQNPAHQDLLDRTYNEFHKEYGEKRKSKARARRIKQLKDELGIVKPTRLL